MPGHWVSEREWVERSHDWESRVRSEQFSGERIADTPCPFFLRSDKTLQDIVYKLVPGLFKGICTPFLLLPTDPISQPMALSSSAAFFQMR